MYKYIDKTYTELIEHNPTIKTVTNQYTPRITSAYGRQTLNQSFIYWIVFHSIFIGMLKIDVKYKTQIGNENNRSTFSCYWIKNRVRTTF